MTRTTLDPADLEDKTVLGAVRPLQELVVIELT
jgi:hypothetical protein